MKNIKLFLKEKYVCLYSLENLRVSIALLRSFFLLILVFGMIFNFVSSSINSDTGKNIFINISDIVLSFVSTLYLLLNVLILLMSLQNIKDDTNDGALFCRYLFRNTFSTLVIALIVWFFPSSIYDFSLYVFFTLTVLPFFIVTYIWISFIYHEKKSKTNK